MNQETNKVFDVLNEKLEGTGFKCVESKIRTDESTFKPIMQVIIEADVELKADSEAFGEE